MKILLFADLHLDTPFRWASAEIGRARRRALVATLKKIVDVALDHEVDAVCSGGDLYEHELVSPDTPALLRKEFARLGNIPVLLAPGNHDWYGSRSVYARTGWSPNVHVFTGTGFERFPLTGGLSIWGAAHDRKRGTPGFLDNGFKTDGSDDMNIALFHGSDRARFQLEEGKDPHAPFDAAQIPEAGFSHALVGHLHSPRQGEWHTYPGNPEPLTFGETGERGAVLVELSASGVIARTVIPVNQTQVADVTVDVTGSQTRDEVRERVEEALSPHSGMVRVTVRGTVASEVSVTAAELEGVGPHCETVELRVGEIDWDYNIEYLRTLDTVQGEFVREVLRAGFDPDKERRVLVTGLRALDGRKDLAVL